MSTAHKKLSELSSTAIAGNDILSSCLYVCGIAILFAGVWAPLVFIVIGIVLYLYKHVYTEVVEALPLNGGAYNCLLNATNKPLAAIAGVMTTLSYVATSVISAKTAAEYVHTVWHGLPVLPTTAAIIIAFALLVMMGVKDSAVVAKAIFGLHIFTLSLLVSLGLLSLVNSGWGHLFSNWQLTQDFLQSAGTGKMLFFAFAASLLGVSGFESSANFVEEQEAGVFRKTLKNMWLGVVVFNPLIALVVLHALDMPAIVQVKDFVLADVGLALGGLGLKYLIVADAFFVLSGAVLASFVGASGLLYRMTLDHCFPSKILLPKLRARNQNGYRIIIAFGLLCLSILFVTKGELLSLAGVYTISFLGVMTLFAIGNLILRRTRSDLKRTYRGPLLYTILAATATGAGIIGNILIDPNNFIYFLWYFVPTITLVYLMIYRDIVLDSLLNALGKGSFLYERLQPWFEHVIRPRIIVFAHHPEKLFSTLEYIEKNETSRNISVVFCTTGEPQARKFALEFDHYISTFKAARVFPNLNIDLVIETELKFNPETVRMYAHRYRITRNNIFIGTIHHTHGFTFEDLGGVRIVQS
jgi:amino acid transporter